MMKYFRVLAVAGIAAILALLVINPVISTPATPLWEVWVVDANGRALSGMTVRLSWQNYSAETSDHQEDQQTDEKGYVVFPARKFRASINERLLGTIRAADGGVHASFGPHAFVFAFGKGLQGPAVTGEYVADWTGKPNRMQSRIVAEPMR
jgi:hypothetical protein